MLKSETISVIVEGFTVSEVDPEFAADFRDKVVSDNPELGNAKILYVLSRDMFIERVTEWPYSEPCDEENKLVFYKHYTTKAAEIISSAEKKIKTEREKRLGNLLSGATGILKKAG